MDYKKLCRVADSKKQYRSGDIYNEDGIKGKVVEVEDNYIKVEYTDENGDVQTKKIDLTEVKDGCSKVTDDVSNSVREVKYTNGVVRSFLNDLNRCSQIMYGDEWIDFLVDAPTMDEAISFLKAKGGKFVEENYIAEEEWDAARWPAEKEMKDYDSFYREFFSTI